MTSAVSPGKFHSKAHHTRHGLQTAMPKPTKTSNTPQLEQVLFDTGFHGDSQFLSAKTVQFQSEQDDGSVATSVDFDRHRLIA